MLREVPLAIELEMLIGSALEEVNAVVLLYTELSVTAELVLAVVVTNIVTSSELEIAELVMGVEKDDTTDVGTTILELEIAKLEVVAEIADGDIEIEDTPLELDVDL